MISILFCSILCHLQSEIYDMILLILNDLKDHVRVLKVNVLLEWKYRERINNFHLLSDANLPADAFNVELE
jgi:hypothetical protein